jgi:CRP-like cAMP-binding protein
MAFIKVSMDALHADTTLSNYMHHLAEVPLLRQCTPAQRQHLAQHARLEHHAKGKVLFLSGDRADHFFLVLTGWVKLYRETLDGMQAIVDVLPAGHLFGETALFEENVFPFSAEVIEPATLLRLPIAVLSDEISKDPALALAMLRVMVQYRRQQDQELEHTKLQSAPQRIGCFLLRLLDQRNQGPFSLNLPYDKTLIASRLGMQPETFSRALTRLKDETGIRISGARIEGDAITQLAIYACGACSSTFPCKDKAG